MDEETKTKILQLHDPAENLKTLDPETVERLVSSDPTMMFWKEAKTDEMNKIYRIFTGNHIQVCPDEDLYSNTKEDGLYSNMSRINHSCVPNTNKTWVMGDFRRHQVRAMTTQVVQGREVHPVGARASKARLARIGRCRRGWRKFQNVVAGP